MSDHEKLINASDLIEWIMETYSDWCVGDVRGIVDHVEALPSARKKGKWMWDGESRREYPYKCSECGEIDYYAFLYDAETREYKQQDIFCPNCGADMSGEGE